MTSCSMDTYDEPTESTPLIFGDELIASMPPVRGRGFVDPKRSESSPPRFCSENSSKLNGSRITPRENRSISGVNLVLMNTGSVARDHLSSERTYLAYVRTSLALASAGVALMQFLRLGEHTQPYAGIIGSFSVMAAIGLLLMGTRRFFLIQRALVQGSFPESSFEMISTSFALGSLIAGTFAIIVVGLKG